MVPRVNACSGTHTNFCPRASYAGASSPSLIVSQQAALIAGIAVRALIPVASYIGKKRCDGRFIERCDGCLIKGCDGCLIKGCDGCLIKGCDGRFINAYDVYFMKGCNVCLNRWLRRAHSRRVPTDLPESFDFDEEMGHRARTRQ